MVSLRGVKGFENNTVSGIGDEINQWVAQSTREFNQKGNKFAMVDVKFQYHPRHNVSGAAYSERVYAMVIYDVEYRD